MESALSRIRDQVPILKSLGEYDAEDARGDVTAGLTVGVMLIPQGMAYAVLAGMPPIYGLYASVVPLLIYPLLGSSRHLAVGLNAVPMLIVAAGIGGIAAEGTEEYISLAILSTAMVGLILLAMGALRLGFLAILLSRPVIAGFATAAALIIMASQIGAFLGVELGRSEYIHVLVLAAIQELHAVHLPSLAVAAGSVATIVGLRKWKPYFPAELSVIVLATVASWLLDLESHGVTTVGGIPTGFPVPEVPALDLPSFRELLPTAITLAMIQFMSAVSLARIFAERHRYSIDANQELLALGASNFIGSFFHCLPSTGSFSRTAVNDHAGARTSMSNFVAAGVVALVLLFFTPLLRDLPLAALAAIIMVAALGLFDISEVRYLFRTKRMDGWVALMTFLTTLVIGVEEGLLLGIAAATVAVLFRQSRPYVAELGHLTSTRSFKNLDRFAKAYPIEGLMILRIEAGFSFFNAQFLKNYILGKATESGVRAVVLDAGSINYLDTTAVQAIESVAETLEEKGIEIYFAGLTGPVRDIMARAGLGEVLGPDRFHITPHRAVRHILSKWDMDEGTRRLELYEHSAEMDEKEVDPTEGSHLT
ncbi:MAG: SulP family inorganic anion transporter [Gemmatimonadota bacterium]